MKRTELSWSIPPSKKLKVCKNVKALNKAEENIIESSPMSAPSFHSGNENSKSLRNKKKKSDIMDKSHIQLNSKEVYFLRFPCRNDSCVNGR